MSIAEGFQKRGLSMSSVHMVFCSLAALRRNIDLKKELDLRNAALKKNSLVLKN